MQMRWLLILATLTGLVGCAKRVEWPDIIVKASSPAEYADFRAELSGRYPADQLQALDTATQELKLDALNRDVRVAGRDADMCAKIDGRTIQVALVLGWRARQARFKRELDEVQKILEDVQAAKDRSVANGTPLAASVPAQIQSAGAVIDQLNRNLAETERQLKVFETAGGKQ